MTWGRAASSLFLLQCILVLLARRSSGELRCSATALISPLLSECFDSYSCFQCVWRILLQNLQTFESPHDNTNKMACAPSEDSDEPGHPPSLIRVCMKKAWVLSYSLSALRWLWSDLADAQADLSLAGHTGQFVGFVLRGLISCFFYVV